MSETALTIQTADVSRVRRLYEEEVRHLQEGAFVSKVGTLTRAKAVYNITTHRLHEAAGYQSLKAWSEDSGYSYRRVQQLLAMGRDIADLVFGKDIPAEQRVLTLKHVKRYAEALQASRTIAKYDPLRLPESTPTELDYQDIIDERDKRLIGRAYHESDDPSASTPDIDEHRSRKSHVADILTGTLHKAAMQTYSLQLTKKLKGVAQKEALYYTLLNYWLLTQNVNPKVAWFDFSAAMSMLKNEGVESLPVHVRYALGLGKDGAR